MIIQAILIILLFALIIIFHEMGHKFGYYLITGRTTKFKFQEGAITLDIDFANDKEYIIIALYGILFGLIPMAVLFDIWNYGIIGRVIVITLYFMGCRHDMQNILRKLKKIYLQYKQKKKNEKKK
jgi:hypothetical protein